MNVVISENKPVQFQGRSSNDWCYYPVVLLSTSTRARRAKLVTVRASRKHRRCFMGGGEGLMLGGEVTDPIGSFHWDLSHLVDS